MERKQFIKIITWSTIALIVPILGQLFINGWNWGVTDFIFAWVFFTALGITYTFVTNKVHGRGKVASGILVILAFVFIWAILATG